jgi:hypothetical protein
MAGYTPEEIAMMRAKIAGTPTVGEFDRKASDVSASASRLGDNQYVKGILGGMGGGLPATPMVRDAAEQIGMRGPGGPADLSRATQNALANRPPDAPEQLNALNSPTPDVQAVPSLKDRLVSKLGGGAGGGGGNGLYSAFMAARRKQLGDFDTDKALAAEQGDNRAQHVMTLAEWQQADAAEKQRHAEIDMKAQEDAHEKTQALIGRNQELADDIGRQKIDPKRLAKSMGAGERIEHVLGASLGGFLRGFQGGENKTLERFDNEVTRDIQAQINEIDNKKAQLGARQNLVAQMIQETGDRRLGVLAARNLYYEAAKQKLAATDAQLGVPEIKTAAQQQAQQFQHQQDAMNTQFTAEAYQQQQRAAQAAAAAQKAAEKEAYERQMRVAELGQKQDHLNIEAAKVAGGTLEDLNKQAQFLGKELSDPKLAMGRAAVEASKSRLEKAGPGEGLPGVGTSADLREKLAGRPTGVAALFPQNWVINKVAGLNDEERVSRNDWAAVRQAYINQATGSGGSAEERADIIKTFQGAQTPAEQRAAIAKADAYFKQQETNLRGSVDPRANAMVEARKAGLAGIQPRQGNVSDERAKQFKKKLTGSGY